MNQYSATFPYPSTKNKKVLSILGLTVAEVANRTNLDTPFVEVDLCWKSIPDHPQRRIVWISIAILICLFLVQTLGTDKFRRNKKDVWISLGGVLLCVTGTEAMFADLGHFTVRSIQISMCSVMFPCLILAYAGQASYLRDNMNDVSQTFYRSIPGPLYWPMFVVAVVAAIIASQAMISGTFSIIQQPFPLGCFPLVKVVHTSSKYECQVYIPEINYILMIACVAVTAGFRTTVKIGNAYGIAVVFVMTLTSALLVLVMVMIWKIHILLIIAYILVIGSVELLYLSCPPQV